jgi:glycosyltransferase involved in cell wall biosynthesis
MKRFPKNFVFWWPIPCKAISGVFRELSKSYNVTVVCERGLSRERKNLGWELADYGESKLIVLSDGGDWKNESYRILHDEINSLHVFASVYAYERIRFVMNEALKLNITISVMSESILNSRTGIMWFVKEIYIRFFLPFRTKSLAKKSFFTLCLSGSSSISRKSLKRLGFLEDSIYPFGYFSEQYFESKDIPITKCNKIIKILCTGYLIKEKGHELLIKVLKDLKDLSIKFQCDITGYGSEESKLRELTSKLGLDEMIFFRGVVSTSDLYTLMLNADIFVAPGRREPWGIRINEAIQADLALVISDGIGACELVEKSKCGFIFRAGDRKSLAESLISLISDPNLILKFKNNSRNFKYNIHPNIAAQYFESVVSHALNPQGPKPLPPWS